MRRLAVYPPAPSGLTQQSLDRDPACSRCELSGAAQSVAALQGRPIGSPPRTPCMAAEGDPGGLLVLGEYPFREDDAGGRPWSSASARMVRALVARHWQGPVAWDNAVRCAPPRGWSDAQQKKAVRACEPYLIRLLQEVRPTRVLMVGSLASHALVGRRPWPLAVRGGYAYVQLPGGGEAVAWFVGGHLYASRNRFARAWMEEDVRRALEGPPPAPPPRGAVALLVEDEADALEAEAELRAAAAEGLPLSPDLETEGELWSPEFRAITAAVAVRGEDRAYVWPRRALEDGAPELEPLRRLLTDPALPKIMHNGKYDSAAWRSHHGERIEGVYGDTRSWRKLDWSDNTGDLEDAQELVGMGGGKEEMAAELARVQKALRSKKPDEAALANVPAWVRAAVRLGMEPRRYLYGMVDPDLLARYCALDAISTARVGTLMEPRLRARPAAWRMWDRRVSRDARAFEQIEAWGLAADRARVEAFRAHLQGQVDALGSRFDALGVNPGSAPQVAKYLYQTLNLPVLERTEGGAPSTAEHVLERLGRRAPVAADLLAWRKASKLLGTYAQPLPGFIRADGRVHPNYLIDGTRTGRPSAHDPNLLNCPRPTTPEGKMMRDCYVASPGYLLLEADYSQIELRVAAMLSGDPVMRQIFVDGVDYHQRTAELISQIAWGIPPEAVTPAHRQEAKPVNFGLLYGLSDAALAGQVGCSVAQAEKIRQAILGRLKVLARWILRCVSETRRSGEAWTWWAGEPARCRSLHGIADGDGPSASVAEHSSYNTRVQGTASEFCLESVAQLVEWIVGERLEDEVKLVLTVYDSIMFEVREDRVADVARKARAVMTGHDSMGVPLVADFKVGPSWGSLKHYEVP